MLKDRKLLTDGSSAARQWLHILLLILIPALTFSNTLGNDLLTKSFFKECREGLAPLTKSPYIGLNFKVLMKIFPVGFEFSLMSPFHRQILQAFRPK